MSFEGAIRAASRRAARIAAARHARRRRARRGDGTAWHDARLLWPLFTDTKD